MNPASPAEASIAEAKNHLPSLVQRAEGGETIRITRRGRPVAILLSTLEYERLRAPRTDLGDFLTDWRAQVREDQVELEADVFAQVRDNAPGRDMHFE